jgi:sugar phosphate isomerase/epimerase
MTRSLDRREFLGRAALAGAGLALSSGVAAAADDPYAGFKVGAQSYTWRNFNLEQALTKMQELGLKYVEFATGHVPATATPEQLKAFVRLCNDHGVTPAAWGVHPFGKDQDKNRKLFEAAKLLGVQVMSADPSPDSFDNLDKLVEEYDVAVAIHPHGPSGKNLHRWYSAEIILAAVKDHHPKIGSCLDTGHLIRSAQPPFGKKLDPAQQIRVMGKRNFGVHLKDHDNEKREDVVFGQGVLDVSSVLKALRDVGFTGAVAIEYEAHPENPSPDVRACLEVLKASASKLA